MVETSTLGMFAPMLGTHRFGRLLLHPIDDVQLLDISGAIIRYLTALQHKMAF